MVPSQQTPPYKIEEELDSTPIALIASIGNPGIHTEQGNEGISGADQGTSSSPDHPDHPDRLCPASLRWNNLERTKSIDEWVVQLTEVDQQEGVSYDEVKEPGVPKTRCEKEYRFVSSA